MHRVTWKCQKTKLEFCRGRIKKDRKTPIYDDPNLSSGIPRGTAPAPAPAAPEPPTALSRTAASGRSTCVSPRVNLSSWLSGPSFFHVSWRRAPFGRLPGKPSMRINLGRAFLSSAGSGVQNPTLERWPEWTDLQDLQLRRVYPNHKDLTQL